MAYLNALFTLLDELTDEYEVRCSYEYEWTWAVRGDTGRTVRGALHLAGAGICRGSANTAVEVIQTPALPFVTLPALQFLVVVPLIVGSRVAGSRINPLIMFCSLP